MTAATFTPITAFTPDTVAADMRKVDRYVLWKPSVTKDGKPTKVPCNASGIAIDDKNPDNWRPFAVVVKEAMATGYGIAFALGDGWTGTDCDNCRNPETGELTPWAAAIMARFPGWRWEISPSLTGIKGIGKTALTVLPGELAGGRRGTNTGGLPDYLGGTTGKIETYVGARMFCTTGNAVNDVETFEDTTSDYVAFCLETFPPKPPQQAKTTPRPNNVPTDDMDVIEDCRRFKNGPKFDNLMGGSTAEYGGDDSAADFALASILAFRTKDPDQIERIMRLGSLQRVKWDEMRGAETYLRLTIQRAIETVSGSYDPHHGQPGKGSNTTTSGNLHKNITVDNVHSDPAPVSGGSGDAEPVCIPVAELARLQAMAAKVPALEARVRELEGLQSRDKAIIRNKGLGTTRVSAPAVVHYLAAKEAMPADERPADGMHQVTIEATVPTDDGQERRVGFAADVGIGRSTASTHLDHFADHGLIRQETRLVDVVRDGVTTRERRRFIGRPIGVTNAIAHADLFIGADLNRNHGGKREPRLCPHCETDLDVTGTKTITTTVCLDCGGIVDETERRRPTSAPNPMSQIDTPAPTPPTGRSPMSQFDAPKNVTTTLVRRPGPMYQIATSGEPPPDYDRFTQL
jgi:hypothetical protein